MTTLSLCLLTILALSIGSEPLPAKSSAAAPAAYVGDWRFGVIESYEDPGEASNLGASWTRVIFHWAEVQPGGAGTWTPKITDEQINGEINAGRMVIGLLIGIPGWAIDSNGLPNGLWLPHNDPGNAWGTFVREAVSRYQGRINHWIIWNEPDISSGAVAHTWNGTVEDFFQLQRTAYLVAKEVNPNVVIHLSAFTHFWDPTYFGRYLDVVTADLSAPVNNYYFDVATTHLYFQPHMVFDLIQLFYGTMGSRGIYKPIWLVETNAPPSEDPAWPVPDPFLKVSLEEQAAYMPQVLASALSAGAHRIAIYKLKDRLSDQGANPEPFGLVRIDGSRRPAYNTYQVAVRYLAGMTGAKRVRWDAIGQFHIEQGPKTTEVLFSRLPSAQQAEVIATGEMAVLVDMWGGRQVVTASDGHYYVNLPGASCTQTAGEFCMIGGTTYYLVQGGELPPTNTPAPSATPIETTPPTVTVTPTMTHTPTATRTPQPIPTDTATSTRTPPPTPPLATSTRTKTTELAQVPLEESPESIIVPRPLSEKGAVSPENGLSYWFIGGGLVVAIGLALGRIVKRRQDRGEPV